MWTWSIIGASVKHFVLMSAFSLKFKHRHYTNKHWRVWWWLFWLHRACF